MKKSLFLIPFLLNCKSPTIPVNHSLAGTYILLKANGSQLPVKLQQGSSVETTSAVLLFLPDDTFVSTFNYSVKLDTNITFTTSAVNIGKWEEINKTILLYEVNIPPRTIVGNWNREDNLITFPQYGNCLCIYVRR